MHLYILAEEKALTDYINELLTDKIQAALNTTVTSSNVSAPNIQTNEHWDILSEIKDVLKNTIDVNKISLKHTVTYYNFFKFLRGPFSSKILYGSGIS